VARVSAPEGLTKLSQRDFSAGAFPGDGVSVAVTTGEDQIPPNGCADILNGLIDEDGSVFRRGGTAYVGTFAANFDNPARPFRNLWSGYLGVVGQVAIASRLQGSPTVSERFYAWDGSDFSTQVWAGTMGPQRPVAYMGMVVFATTAATPGVGIQVAAWGGTTAAAVNNQSVTFTKDSKAVTGAGTSFGSAAPGMILHQQSTVEDRVGVIESIQDNTHLTLLNPWPVDTVTVTVDIVPYVILTFAEPAMPAASGPVTTAALSDRLVFAHGSRLTFTMARDQFSTNNDEYHELPYGASIVGMEPLRDQLLVFSTGGIFMISGLAYELTDPRGNPQQRLERVAPDLILWDNNGVASWRGSVVAPCADDVYLIDSAAAMRPIGGGMRRLYRSYVKQGFQTGVAAVFAGRYILPVLNAGTWVDTLVCDLRTGAWTRWGDYGATVTALATRIGETTRQPQLWALGSSGASPRVLDLSQTISPAAAVKNDADGSTHKLRVVTRTFDLGDLIEHTWRKVRLRMELEDAASDDPHMEAYTERDRIAPTQTDLVDDVGEGERIYTWPVRERTRGIRFQFTQWGASARARIRAVDVFVRRSEKL
jgi:hypothetical protein